MKKQLIIHLFLISTVKLCIAQVGVGVGGGILHTGFLKSELNNSQFEVGMGYEFFARHKLFEITQQIGIDAKYSFRKYASRADLPFTASTRFDFNSLVVDFLTNFKKISDWQIYGGVGLAMVTASAEKDFLRVTETIFVPEILLGIELVLSKYFNFFSEFQFQFGSVKISYSQYDDHLPITGGRIFVGGTMFLTE
jgi:hypothetical protein